MSSEVLKNLEEKGMVIVTPHNILTELHYKSEENIDYLQKRLSISLIQYCKAGEIYRFGRSIYSLKSPELLSSCELYDIATRLRHNSYVSRESVLGMCKPTVIHLMGDRSEVIARHGISFRYHKLKTQMLSSVVGLESRGNSNSDSKVIVATKSRAIVDLLYRNSKPLKLNESIRSQIDFGEARAIALDLYKSPTLYVKLEGLAHFGDSTAYLNTGSAVGF